MNASEVNAQLTEMLNELDGAVNLLNNVDEKLETLEGSALLLGLSQSQNGLISGLIQVITAAKHNRETLWRFLFNIRVRIEQYQQVL